MVESDIGLWTLEGNEQNQAGLHLFKNKCIKYHGTMQIKIMLFAFLCHMLVPVQCFCFLIGLNMRCKMLFSVFYDIYERYHPSEFFSS